MTVRSQQVIPESVVRQAIAWRVRLDSECADEEDYQACSCWRDSDPLNEQAWQRLENMESGLRRMAEQAPCLVKKTIIQTDAECRRIGRRKALKMVGSGLSGVAGLALLAQQQGVWQQLNADFNTAGQRQAFTLQDSSRLWLNRNSSVELDFSSQQRSLLLTRGEINLQAAGDALRPVSVQLSVAQLQTYDAHFTLRLDGGKPLLHVQDGTVQVSPQQYAVQTLVAGDAVHVTESGMIALDSREFDYSSWTDGLLVARGMPMQQFCDELQRYHSGLIRMHPSLKQHPVSGVYQLQDTHLVLQLLARSAGAELIYRSRWWADIRPASLA